jgi:phosphohistidine phosphatase
VDLYLIRHAEAYPVGEGGATADEERPLTEQGEAQARQVGAGLQRRGVRPEVVVTSPLVRARQTAEHVLAQFSPPGIELQVCAALAPGSKRRKLARALNELAKERLALVGHLPDLAEWGAWLIGSKKAHLELAKAGVALVRCDGEAAKGAGTLSWLVPPSWLTDKP